MGTSMTAGWEGGHGETPEQAKRGAGKALDFLPSTGCTYSAYNYCIRFGGEAEEQIHVFKEVRLTPHVLES